MGHASVFPFILERLVVNMGSTGVLYELFSKASLRWADGYKNTPSGPHSPPAAGERDRVQ
jgi:hypothetical protein